MAKKKIKFPRTITVKGLILSLHPPTFLSNPPPPPLGPPTDILVSPLRPVKRFAELSSEEVCDLFLCVHRIAPVLEQAHASTSLTIALQDGRQAGQTVEHVHVHMLPRKEGDFQNNDDIYDKVIYVYNYTHTLCADYLVCL